MLEFAVEVYRLVQLEVGDLAWRRRPQPSVPFIRQLRDLLSAGHKTGHRHEWVALISAVVKVGL
jgi:hypothetical protein